MFGRLALLATLAGCAGSAAAVSSTTSAHGGPVAAPEAPDRATRGGARQAALRPSDDPAERIVFLAGGVLTLLDPSTGQTQRVRGPRDAERPALSPRGTALAFAAGGRLWILDPLDGEPRALTDGAGGGDHAPAWSPDGRKLVFTRGVQRDLYVLDFDASGPPRPILAGRDRAAAFAGAPAWSPDGSTIVFCADRDEGEGTGLWLIAPDGSGLRRLTRPERRVAWARDLAPAWSPDGKTIVFARHVGASEDRPDYDLFVVDVASGAVARLTEDPGSAGEPVYSPDGQRIYFVSTRDAAREYESELYAMPAGGGEQRRLTRAESPRHTAPSAGRIAPSP